jgi:ribonuclease HI
MRDLTAGVSIILAIPVFYLLIPFLLAMCVGGFSRFRHTNRMREVFDFSAHILYPWRWTEQPWKKSKEKGKHYMKTVTIYTDGACSGNPGPGGWGAILLYGQFKKELSGGEASTTNNRMELTGAIAALEALKEPCVVELWSDSKYVIDGLQKGWAKGWKAKGWVKSDKKPALNPDLWDRLLTLTAQHTMHYHWVKGHAENPYNNRCDELAVAESQKFKR